MKNKSLIIFALTAISSVSSAQVYSEKSNVNSVIPNTVDYHTRVMDYKDNIALTYIDSMGNPFLVNRYTYAYLGLSPSLLLDYLHLPSGLIISEMEKRSLTPWFSGSLNGKGVYGRFTLSQIGSTSPNFYHILRLPDMSNVKSLEITPYIMLDPIHRRVFAIGETSFLLYRTHIIELEITGSNNIHETDPYLYGTPNSNEFFDDLKLIDDYVIYTTRDFRSDKNPVNLRMSQIENVLTGNQIDFQWQILFDSTESVYGKVFITRLDESIGPEFEVSYIKYNNKNDNYLLCMHKFNLADLLNGIFSTIVSQEIVISKGKEIVDIKYDNTHQVLLLLLNKNENQSFFIHASPYKKSNYAATQLKAPEGDVYYSIDTLMNLWTSPGRYYVAWGGNKTFTQQFLTGGTIQQTCLTPSEVFVNRKKTTISIARDVLTRHNGTRDVTTGEEYWMFDYENRDCYLSNE